MVTRNVLIPFKRGTTAQNDAYKGNPGEVTIDSTLRTLRVHDGVTQGGEPLLRLRDIDSARDLAGLTNVENKSSATIRGEITSSNVTTALGFVPADQASTYTKTETDNHIQAVVGAAPTALDTLQEIAAQLANDEDAVAALVTTVAGKESAIVAGTASQYWTGNKTWSDLATDVRAVILTGLSTATNAVITATDSVLSALGKLQKQITDLTSTVAAKLDKSGGTMTGDILGGGFKLTNWILKNVGTSYLSKGNSGTTLQTFDFSSAAYQQLTATGNFTWALSNFPTANGGMLLIEATNWGAFTVTPPTVNWIQPSGIPTTSLSTYLSALSVAVGRSSFQASGTDYILIWSRDNVNFFGKLL